MSKQTLKARQTYLDSIQAKTGKSAQELGAMARAKGLTKARAVTDWLKEEYGLGYGHAGFVWYLMAHEDGPKKPEDRLARLFSGRKERWLEPFRRLEAQVRAFGPDASTYANTTYVNLLRGGKKFGIVQPGSERLDIGIKLKGVEAGGRLEQNRLALRLETAGKWNAMVTHRVRVSDPQEVDAQVLTWLKQAYELAR